MGSNPEMATEETKETDEMSALKPPPSRAETDPLLANPDSRVEMAAVGTAAAGVEAAEMGVGVPLPRDMKTLKPGDSGRSTAPGKGRPGQSKG